MHLNGILQTVQDDGIFILSNQSIPAGYCSLQCHYCVSIHLHARTNTTSCPVTKIRCYLLPHT